MCAENHAPQKWLLGSCWLILLWAVGCVQGETPVATAAVSSGVAASSPHVIKFEVTDPAAMAGNEINLHWETEAVDHVAIEVWGFVSYEVPQIQQIVNHTYLAAVGSQTITMPGAPAGVYLIVDSSISRYQPPNTSIELHPTFYQSDVQRFTVSKATAHPGDGLTLEWETNSIHPLLLKTFLIFETIDRSWIEPAEQFDKLSESGTVMVTVPDAEPNLVGMSFELYYRNHTYIGYIRTVKVDVRHN